MNKKNLLVVCASGIALGFIFGVTLQKLRSPDKSTAITKSQHIRTYAMNVALGTLPFWSEPRQTWQKIGRAIPDLKTIFGGPTDSDPAKQIEELETLISQGVDGIVVFSADPHALVPTINKAVDKGIPVVTVFADVPKSKRFAYVGANQVESARSLANLVTNDFSERVKPDAKVLISFGKVGAQDQDERRHGFEEAVKGKMRLVNPVVDDYQPDKAAEAIRAAMSLNPDIKFIFGCDSQSAIGAISALKEMGKKPGDVIVTGWDSEPVVMKEIKTARQGSAWIYATAVLPSCYMIQMCFSLLEAAHFGYLRPDTPARQKTDLPAVPQIIEIPMKIVSPHNVDNELSNCR